MFSFRRPALADELVRAISGQTAFTETPNGLFLTMTTTPPCTAGSRTACS